MARREALRELQSRLAQRLLAARSEQPVAAWLAVESRGRGLLFPLQQAGEIFPLTPLLPVPHAQPWFVGVANLRGRLHGVVDLGAFLGLPAAADAPAARDPARLIAMNPAAGLDCALLVDALAGLRNVTQLQFEEEPSDNPGVAARPAFAGARLRDTQGRVWQEILLLALAQHEQFLAITGSSKVSA